MSGSASFLMEKKSSLRGLGACRNKDGAAMPANWAVWLFRGYATQVLEGGRWVSIHCRDREVLKGERGERTG